MGHPCLFFSFAFLQLCDLKKRKLLISTGVHVRGMFSFFTDPIQRLGRQHRHMGLWPLGFQSYGPFLKSMGHYSNGVGQKKRNIGIFVSDVTFRTSIIQYRQVNIIIK